MITKQGSVRMPLDNTIMTPAERQRGLVELINSWLADSSTDEEQRREFDEFARAIDEDRPPGRKLFS